MCDCSAVKSLTDCVSASKLFAQFCCRVLCCVATLIRRMCSLCFWRLVLLVYVGVCVNYTVFIHALMTVISWGVYFALCSPIIPEWISDLVNSYMIEMNKDRAMLWNSSKLSERAPIQVSLADLMILMTQMALLYGTRLKFSTFLFSLLTV